MPQFRQLNIGLLEKNKQMQCIGTLWNTNSFDIGIGKFFGIGTSGVFAVSAVLRNKDDSRQLVETVKFSRKALV